MKGDRAAFEELVRRTARMVYARLYLETGDMQRTEDLVQETFLRAFRSVGRLTEPSGFRRWLLSVALSVAIDSFRREARQKRTAPRFAGPGALEGAEAPPDGDEEVRERARAVLQSLPEEYRLPLTLRYINGSDYEEITMQLGITDGSLRGLLHRGLQLLRRSLKTEVCNGSF